MIKYPSILSFTLEQSLSSTWYDFVGPIVKSQTHSYPIAGMTLDIEVHCRFTIQNVTYNDKRDTFSCLINSHKILRNNN
jgi:hypothetical protein